MRGSWRFGGEETEEVEGRGGLCVIRVWGETQWLCCVDGGFLSLAS